MRFFTSITPAGKGEYFAIAVVLNIALFYVAFVVFKLEPDFDTLTFGYALDKIPEMAFTYVAYAGLMFLNSIRRLKRLKKTNFLAYFAALPVVGLIVQFGLVATDDFDKSSYTPYGDNPYDPNSWVPPASSGKPGAPVSFRGEALILPGEDQWDDAA